MAVIGWLFVTGVISVLSILWWIVAPFYLGSYSARKSVTRAERMVAAGAGLALGAAWWLIVVERAPFIITLK